MKRVDGKAKRKNSAAATVLQLRYNHFIIPSPCRSSIEILMLSSSAILINKVSEQRPTRTYAIVSSLNSILGKLRNLNWVQVDRENLNKLYPLIHH